MPPAGPLAHPEKPAPACAGQPSCRRPLFPAEKRVIAAFPTALSLTLQTYLPKLRRFLHCLRSQHERL
ncbi:hypothetical protein DESPIG_01437 [Desulfovibrio piger ATCC 29098]|uniref:Uncharacterized protein n=1 Tax=Desulfovibrio piger ATCC 29098 TaxID=411464 RepID=B6WTN1_9BACT|nr:hypothetical protein DESPIG_01437 [Desulfovibrio piger ATCC 29098]